MSEAAAWVQAIGSIIAIGVAVWVPFKIHSNETHKKESEIRLKGQATALLIQPLLLVVDGQLERQAFLRPSGAIQIEIPDELLNLTKDFWQMGAAGHHLMQLIGALQSHNGVVRDTISYPMDMEDEEREEYSRLYHERMDIARACIKDANSAIEDLLS